MPNKRSSGSSSSSAAAAKKQKSSMSDPYTYLNGFGNEFESEAEANSLPTRGATPQRPPHGLYAEQLSGSAFTAPRSANKRSWLYRIRPSVVHMPPAPAPVPSASFADAVETPNQLRWDPPELLPIPTNDSDQTKETQRPVHFVAGWQRVAGVGDPATKTGLGIYLYRANTSMGNTSAYSADGDLLIVPQQGALDIRTEFGRLYLTPGEIAVIPRGIVYSVDLGAAESVRGYLCEVYNGHFKLPDLGPIGANGLANPRDFQTPTAWYEDVEGPHVKLSKFMNRWFTSTLDHSPFDVVGWFGNYVPFKYDLTKFCAVNSVTYDHMDPSIFTVLTCATTEPGVAACDFVIFPPRWMVAEDTFRPPYYHRNCMSEYMGLIRGEYDAKKGGKGGFVPGGGSLHSCMSAHGPDRATHAAASAEEQRPVRYPDTTMAFMFESTYLLRVAKEALESPTLQQEYYKCWAGIERHFSL